MDSSNAVVLSAKNKAVRATWLGLFLVVLIGCFASQGLAATGRFIAHNTPNYVATAANLGTEDPAKVIEVSFWLKPHNRGQLDAITKNLYDPTSPQFRHFLTRQQIATRFAPSAAEMKVVRQFLAANNLKVMRVGPMNFFVHAKGTVGDIENALHVQLNQYQVGSNVMRANNRDPYVDGAAALLVRAISGLDSGEYTHPMATRPGPPSTKPGKALAAMAPAAPDSSFFSNNCFDGTETESFSTNNNGSFPIGTYKGNHINLQSLTSAGCGYTPPMIQAAYNLNALYAEGFDGSGQTIGIIDWCGSLTIQSDANAFSAQFGLPQLTSSNFAITYVPTVSTCQAMDQTEINIDVEWAHAIAPGANINLIVPPSANFSDVDEAEFTAVAYGLANVLSGSYGSPESFTPTSILDTENLNNEIAAVSGISANFSSGDQGDFTFFGIPPTVSAPADSPFATAVGGVTLALNADNSIAWQAGWGNNETLLAEEGMVFDPPLFFGFIGGAGGGPSNCVYVDVNFNCTGGFLKPSYQKKLPGKWRQVPDVSWLADPFTGGVIAISVPFQIPSLTWQVWGGTSLACPMFSALWAIANQEAGAPLGLAAPYLYSLPAGAVTDIVPVATKHNVTGSIQESATTIVPYSAAQMLGGSVIGKYADAIWDYAPLADTGVLVSFGMDCSAESPAAFFGTLCTDPTRLKTKLGWDNVTGVGTPNGKAFADAFHP
jgi:subtilase family serine protease